LLDRKKPVTTVERRVLRKPAEMSRSNSTERKPNKENPVRNSAGKHTRKPLPNPNPMKPSAGEHQPPPDLSNSEGNKNSKTLIAWGHKNSTNNSQG
jgi:hypothetical protein